jgi:hypothetical protein
MYYDMLLHPSELQDPTPKLSTQSAGEPLNRGKISVSFCDFLGHGLGVAKADAPYLPDLVRLRSATA